jgi:hypothetical protein
MFDNLFNQTASARAHFAEIFRLISKSEAIFLSHFCLLSVARTQLKNVVKLSPERRQSLSSSKVISFYKHFRGYSGIEVEKTFCFMARHVL